MAYKLNKYLRENVEGLVLLFFEDDNSLKDDFVIGLIQSVLEKMNPNKLDILIKNKDIQIQIDINSYSISYTKSNNFIVYNRLKPYWTNLHTDYTGIEKHLKCLDFIIEINKNLNK